MTDPRVENLAKILVNYSVKVKPGDWVLVHGHVLAMSLVEAVLRHVIQAGGNPTILLDNEAISEIILRESNDKQLAWISPLDNQLYHQMDVMINLLAASNTRALTAIEPEKMRSRQQSRRPLTETFMERSAQGSLRWVLTQFPCDAYAQDADMSLKDYEDFVYAATFADQPDPISSWQGIHEMQERLIQWLRGKKQVELRGPNSQITLSIEDRTFINSDGSRNMPSGEIFTGPVEESVNGWIRFTYPAISGGREVDGVELEFKDGKVVKASARKNEAFLLSMLDSDPGARYLGEFAIGTNYGIKQFTRSILYDEKIGGSIHMAVGGGYPETGSLNKSSIHWDFICDMRNDSEILVDGELFYKNGEFVV